jgi:hypothetical protein
VVLVVAQAVGLLRFTLAAQEQQGKVATAEITELLRRHSRLVAVAVRVL